MFGGCFIKDEDQIFEKQTGCDRWNSKMTLSAIKQAKLKVLMTGYTPPPHTHKLGAFLHSTKEYPVNNFYIETSL